MAPKKKTSIEKRKCRSANSPWHLHTGEAKRARTEKWAESQRASLLQFLRDNHWNWRDLHSVLVSHFNQELRYDTIDAGLPPPEEVPLSEKSEDGATQPVTGGDTEVQPDPIARDVDALLREVPLSRLTAHEWLVFLQALNPEDVPFNVFGLKETRFQYSKSGPSLSTATSSSAPISAAEPQCRGIWSDYGGRLAIGAPQPYSGSESAAEDASIACMDRFAACHLV